jgi:hypothetical protein
MLSRAVTQNNILGEWLGRMKYGGTRNDKHKRVGLYREERRRESNFWP